MREKEGFTMRVQTLYGTEYVKKCVILGACNTASLGILTYFDFTRNLFSTFHFSQLTMFEKYSRET